MRWFRRRPASAATPLPEIKRSFESAASDEEHFPASIDPRIAHVQLVLREVAAVSPRRVLDAGCGKGRFARHVAAQHPEAVVVAFDLAEAMLRCVPPPSRPCGGTLTALPFPDDCFDAAYATESLEHAVDVETAVAELCRVVRPGGTVVVIDKNVERWGTLATPAWERWFGRREMETLLRRHCRDVRSREIAYWEDVQPDGLFLAWVAQR